MFEWPESGRGHPTPKRKGSKTSVLRQWLAGALLDRILNRRRSNNLGGEIPPNDGERPDHSKLRKILHLRFHRNEKLGRFPVSENYPLFKPYLNQALEIIERKLGV